MKKTLLLLSLLASISIGSFCQGINSTKDSSAKKLLVPKDRDMFGLYIPRGLKINSEGLADGYVMFAVPNSSLVYFKVPSTSLSRRLRWGTRDTN